MNVESNVSCIVELYFERLENTAGKRARCLLVVSTCILLFYHITLTFNDPVKEPLGKHCGKRRKCW